MNWKRIEPQENLDDIVLNIVDEELVQEGIGNLISLGALAFLLGSSGIVNAGQFKQELGKVAKDKQVEQGGKATVTKQDIADAVEKSRADDPRIGRWRRSQILNIVARTLYMEAREDGETGLNLSMTVIWNRAGGGMANQLAEECLRPSQFSCWNGKPKSEKQPSTYEIKFPKCVKTGHGQEYNLWKTCVELAT